MNNHEEYQNLLYQLFKWHAKGYYAIALSRRREMKDYTDELQGKVDSFYEAIKFLKLNTNLHELYRLPWTFTLTDTKYEKSVTVVVDYEGEGKVAVDVKIEPYPVEELKVNVEYSCPNCPIERDPYYLTDDIDNHIVKEYATDEVVAIIKRSKLRDWESFHAASDVVNYLNLSEEEKNKPLKDW